jgi:hypothetical protein
MPASTSGTTVCSFFSIETFENYLQLIFRLEKVIQVKLLDHDQLAVVLVFVNVNQQQLHVVVQVLVVVQVQVFGVFIQKILQGLKLVLYQCLL